jgi:membrane protein YqaA with SNARE-associated domain
MSVKFSTGPASLSLIFLPVNLAALGSILGDVRTQGPIRLYLRPLSPAMNAREKNRRLVRNAFEDPHAHVCNAWLLVLIEVFSLGQVSCLCSGWVGIRVAVQCLIIAAWEQHFAFRASTMGHLLFIPHCIY